LESTEGAGDAKLVKIFASFNEAWMKYWESYVELQDQLYESLRAGREVSWLAATDDAPSKIAELEAALTAEEAGCKDLETAIALMKEKVKMMKDAMHQAGR
jgi:hypothetical protein